MVLYQALLLWSGGSGADRDVAVDLAGICADNLTVKALGEPDSRRSFASPRGSCNDHQIVPFHQNSLQNPCKGRKKVVNLQYRNPTEESRNEGEAYNIFFVHDNADSHSVAGD